MQVSGLRYYSPEMGRWLSRDPIGERGGVHIYCFAGNAPTMYIDFVGAAKIVPWLYLRYFQTSLPAVGLSPQGIPKIISLILTGADVLKTLNGTLISEDITKKKVPDCYVSKQVQDKWILDKWKLTPGGTSGTTLVTLWLYYHHIYEWLWKPDPNDPCCM